MKRRQVERGAPRIKVATIWNQWFYAAIGVESARLRMSRPLFMEFISTSNTPAAIKARANIARRVRADKEAYAKSQENYHLIEDIKSTIRSA